MNYCKNNYCTKPAHEIPFERTDCRHSCCGCKEIPSNCQQEAQYPGAGSVQESFFMLNDGVPYICDNTQDEYGARLSMSECVFTKITRRCDISCVNLDATFDMCDSTFTNTVRKHYLTQTIQNHQSELERVLRVMKSNTFFELKFHVENATGGVVYRSSARVSVPFRKLHFTDVRDLFVTSFKYLINVNIPAMDYDGIYNLCLDSIEAQCDYIDTKSHIINQMNPYYQFTQNNTKIIMQHDAIMDETKDGTVTIAGIELNKVYPFQANLTTRLRLSFVAYMCNTIMEQDTFEVYEALNNPVPAVLDELTDRVDELETEVEAIHEREIQPYTRNTAYKIGVMLYYPEGRLYQATRNFTSSDLESIAVALVDDISKGNIIAIIT